MKYNIANSQETAQLIKQIQLDVTEGHNVADFQWFITTIVEAIDGKIPKVDFRYNTSELSDTVKITKVEVEYTKASPKNSAISITYTNLKTNIDETTNFAFDAELVEENANSVPGQFMKYYINDSDHQVIVSFIFYYK